MQALVRPRLREGTRNRIGAWMTAGTPIVELPANAAPPYEGKREELAW
jgi:hypothetical protein